MNFASVIVALVAVQRLLEVIYAARNTRRLMARGAVEAGREHYPFFILLHASWLFAVALAIPDKHTIFFVPLFIFFALAALRIWVMTSLGPYWTTRIITLPGEPLVCQGPYRYVRHPNYMIVVGEVAMLPLVFGEISIAIFFSIANLLLIAWRIKREDAILAPRREIVCEDVPSVY